MSPYYFESCLFQVKVLSHCKSNQSRVIPSQEVFIPLLNLPFLVLLQFHESLL